MYAADAPWAAPRGGHSARDLSEGEPGVSEFLGDEVRHLPHESGGPNTRAACPRLAAIPSNVHLQAMRAAGTNIGPVERPTVLVICATACRECAVIIELRKMNCFVIRSAGAREGLSAAAQGPTPDAVLALVEPSSCAADRFIREFRDHTGLGSIPIIVGPSCTEAPPAPELAAIVAATAEDSRRLQPTHSSGVRTEGDSDGP